MATVNTMINSPTPEVAVYNTSSYTNSTGKYLMIEAFGITDPNPFSMPQDFYNYIYVSIDGGGGGTSRNYESSPIPTNGQNGYGGQAKALFSFVLVPGQSCTLVSNRAIQNQIFIGWSLTPNF